VSFQKGEVEYTGRTASENEHRDQGNAPTSQVMPKLNSKPSEPSRES